MTRPSPHRWSEVCPEFEKLFGSSDLTIRTLTEVETPAKVLVEDMYFESADILYCAEGTFAFSFRDRAPVTLKAGEALVTHPGHTVTIRAKAKHNKLVYGIFGGESVSSYLMGCGLFDGVHGQVASQYGSFAELRRMIEAGYMDDSEKRIVCLGLLHNIVRSFRNDLRRQGDTLLFDAIQQIHENLHNRIVRVESLCKALKVSRAHLVAVFRANGLVTPSDYIRSEQLRLAKELLSTSRLTISEIAYRLGFKSSAHFNQFVKRLTGRTPRALRRGIDWATKLNN